MIERIVLIKIKDESQVDNVIQKTKEVIAILPGVKSFKTGKVLNNDNYNFGLSMTFDSMEDVEKFSPHPKHREFVDDFLKPLMSGIVAYNVNI
ncbi:MAG: Dabb family protein [Candidatus Marinimicrobia bacterium]|nr:Dabb family protein [Candidatus Neomarinimicrobiota bacterium]